MRAFRFLFLLAVMVVSCISAVGSARADEVSPFPLEITQAAMLRNGEVLSFSATLHNNTQKEMTVRAGAILYALAKDVDAESRSHRIAAPDTYTVAPKSDQSISFVLPRPLLPAGEYQVMVGVAEDMMTRVVSQSPAGTLTFENENVVHLTDCRLGEQSFAQGVIETTDSIGTLSCQTWVESDGYSGRLSVRLLDHPFGIAKELGMKELRFSREKTSVELPLEQSIEPGLYELVVVALDADGRESGLSVRTRLRVPGETKQGMVASLTEALAGKNIESVLPVAESSTLGFWVKAGALVLLALGIAFLAMRRVRVGRRIVAGMLFFLGLALGALVPTQATHAASVGFQYFYNSCSGSCPVATAIFMNVDTKDSYAPGEPIFINVILSSDDNPQAPVGPVLRLQVNGGPLSPDLITVQYTAQELRNGIFLSGINTGLTAPLATGNFTVTVVTGMSGYAMPPSQNMALSVPGAAPTVTLNDFSPSTITAGSASSISFSSTNATSCSGDPGSIWVGNVGTSNPGISTGPMSAGTYTQRLTCTGPGGSVSSVTRTLTVNAAPLPPTVTLNDFSPSTITAGSASSISFSSTNATSCSGDPGSIWVGNVGTSNPGISTGPMSAGTYTQRLTCTGPGGSVSSVTRTLTVNASVVNGVCGSANTQTYDINNSVIPTANRCSFGTYDVNSWGADAGAWYTTTTFPVNGAPFNTGGAQAAYYLGRFWSCDGSGGGTTAGCSLYYRPRCGSANGTTLSSPPPNTTGTDKIALCQIGTASTVVTNPTTYTWNCTNGAGPTDFCTANRPGAAVTATITATGPVAFEQQSWWKKFVSFVIGGDHVAQASGANANITVGQNASITWNSSNAASCSVTGSGPNGYTLSVPSTYSGSQTLSGLQAGTYTYTINCNGATGGSATDSVQVIVTNGTSGTPTPPGVGAGSFFTATPGACGSGSINVAWNAVSGATDYDLERDGSIVNTGSSTSFNHSGLASLTNHSYRVRAHNSAGNSGWTGPINATSPGNCSGTTYTINASASVGGSIAPSGTWSVLAGANQSFTITANSGYTIAAVMVNGIAQGAVSTLNITNINQNYTVVASFNAVASGPSVSLSASPSTITLGNSSLLSWATSGGVTSCWATGGDFTWSNTSQSASGGSRSVSPSVTTTYSIECWDGGGVSTGVRSVTLTVNAAGGPPSVSISASPNPIVSGSSTTLTWSSTNGYFCHIWSYTDVNFVPNNKSVLTSGSMTVNPPVTASYSFECYNSTATTSAVDSVTVTVNSGAAPCSAGALKSWSVSGNACNGTTPGANSGQNGTVNDVTAPTTGSAQFLCTNGSWAASPQAGATCNAAASTYTITVSSGVGGSVAPGTVTNIPAGSSQGFTITPNAGYNIDTVVADGISYGAVNGYAFNNITSNHSLSATFVPLSGGCSSVPKTCVGAAYVADPWNPADTATDWNWTCVDSVGPPYDNVTCTAPKAGNCSVATDTNYNAGPCTGVCANGATNYPTCTFTCSVSTDVNYNTGPCTGVCANGNIDYPTCVIPPSGGCSGDPAPGSQTVTSGPIITGQNVWGNGPLFTTDSYLPAVARYLGAYGQATLSISSAGCNSLYTSGTANGITTASYTLPWMGMNVACTSGCGSLPMTQKICEQTGAGWVNRTGSDIFLPVGGTTRLKTVYDTNPWNDCSGAAYSSVSWIESGTNIATLTASGSERIVTVNGVGMETISVIGPESQAVNIHGICTETASCAASEAQHCSGESYTVTGVCGPLSCTGTRSCDYNWKEVSP